MNSTEAAASTLFLGHNGEWWDFWLIMSLLLAAAAAATVVVATSGSIISHKRESAAAEAALAAYKAQAGEQIAKADAGAATAIKEAALANERTEHERVERLKLEARLAPRRLTQKQHEMLASALKAEQPTPEIIIYYLGDPADSLLAQDIAKAFQDAGSQARVEAETFISPLPPGLLVRTDPKGALRRALNSAGLESLGDGSFVDPAWSLIVGPKPLQ